MYWLLPLELLRRYAEALDERRVRRAEQHRDRTEHDDRDDRQRPSLPHDVREEQHGADHRGEDQEVQRRQLRVHVGVRRALHHAAMRAQEVEPPQVVAPRLDQHDHAEQHREVGASRRGHALAPRAGLRADASPEEVRDRGEERDAHHRREQPALQELEPREAEDVERRVTTELWIRGAERHAGRVPPEQEHLPLPGDADAHEQRQHRRDDRHQPAQIRLERHPHPFHGLLFGCEEAHRRRRDAPRDEQVRVEQREEDERRRRGRARPWCGAPSRTPAPGRPHGTTAGPRRSST